MYFKLDISAFQSFFYFKPWDSQLAWDYQNFVDICMQALQGPEITIPPLSLYTFTFKSKHLATKVSQDGILL